MHPPQLVIYAESETLSQFIFAGNGQMPNPQLTATESCLVLAQSA